MTVALRIRGLTRRFGATQALAGVDLDVRPGRLHALLGENGAGKSTLMHVVDGLVAADSGTMELFGRRYAPQRPSEARAAGVGMVHQHFTSIPALSVWENVTLAAGWSPRTGRQQTREWLDSHGITLPLDTAAEELSVGLRQQLELQRALVASPRLLLLDEPTGVLTPPEVAELFRVIRTFTAAGGTAILITHKLDEALVEAGAITVLRQGAVTLHWDGDDPRPDRRDLIRAMLGGEGTAIPVRPVGGPSTRVVGRSGPLEVHGGEVVGIAGIEGNGQRELLRAFGAAAFIPEDRSTEGLIAEFTLAENVALRAARAGEARTIDWTAVRARTTDLIVAFGVKARGADARASELSGGNQQKIVVARALEGTPALVVAENPARGLDVGAANEIFGRLRQAAHEGAGVVFYSTDLDEVLEWADRAMVITNGVLRPVPTGADRAIAAALMVPDDPQ